MTRFHSKRFQFPLWVLLCIVPVFGGGIGWSLRARERSRAEARAAALVVELGGIVVSGETSQVEKVTFNRSDFLRRSEMSLNMIYAVTADLSDADLGRLAEALRGTNIASLNLSGTQVTDEGIRHLGQLTSLRELGLDGTSTSDAGLSYLSQLTRMESLSLWLTPVSDSGLKHLESLKGLKSLDVEETRVTSEGVRSLQQRLPRLKVIHESTFVPEH